MRLVGAAFDLPAQAPKKVFHQERPGQDCAFSSVLGEEKKELTDSFEQLFRGEVFYECGEGFLLAIQHCRAAMELGMKGVLGVAPGEHRLFHAMSKEYFGPGGPSTTAGGFRRPKHYREVYGRLGGIIHRLEELTESHLRSLILDVDEFLNCPERVGEGT